MINSKKQITYSLLRTVSLFLVLCLLISATVSCGKKGNTGNKAVLAESLTGLKLETDGLTAYSDYIKAYKENGNAESAKISLLNSEIVLVEKDNLPISFTVEKSGLYRLALKTAGGGENLSAYTASLTLNDGYPFAESEQIYFPKQWVIEGNYDNGSQPDLRENTDYSSLAYSNRGYTSEELYWYLEAGNNSIVLTADNQPISLLALEFEGVASKLKESKAPQKTKAESIVIQAEYPELRSDPSILEQIDRISAATVPICENAATYNTLGGKSWQTLGQSVTWSFEIETDGWYCLNMRCRQDYSAGTVSSRRVLIDGSAVSQDAEKLTVPYASGFKRVTLTNENGETVWTYLTKGSHTVTLACTLGELQPALSAIQKSVSELNRIYRRIIMITGTTPDNYRDYHLSEKLPDVFEDIKTQRNILQKAVDYLVAISVDGEADTSAFKKIIRQIDEFLKNEDEIPRQINTFNSNISALGTWLLERAQQPLEIDWLELQPYGGKASEVNCNFFKQLSHDIERIFNSYIEDYDDLGQGETEESIGLWVVSGRDQAQIIQDMSKDFSSQNGIPVNVKLVTADSIMPATVAGIGPDITLFNAPTNVLGYSLRGALVDLSKLSGFDEVITDFHESAITPYRFDGGVWALPETESFPMLFYRSDILKELEISVPNTWDDVYDCITTLQKNNMTFGCPAYEIFLYQNSGDYYTSDAKTSLLNSEESVTAYRIWTKFYTNFDLPMTFNFLNRFRTGEMPMAIVDYSNYNSLVVFAPEIKDSWEMTVVPGTLNPDGTIDRTVNSLSTGAMILKNCNNLDNAWKFLKWWISGDTQGKYARTLETNLGTSARVMVASKSAFENQLWTASEKQLLKSQWEWTEGIPEVAGGYLVGRHINNAFRKIVYQDADIRETLNEYTKTINKEIALKREEYGLDGEK